MKTIYNTKGHAIKLNKSHIESLLGQYSSFEEAVSDAKYTSQLEAYLYLLNGDNVFLCGPAGSGKSYVVQNYCRIMREMNPKINIEKTSTTGLSAINIGGKTIHSFANLGYIKESYEEQYEQMTAPYHQLVMEEMFNSEFEYDDVEAYNKIMRKHSKEFNWHLFNLHKIKTTDILIIDEISMLSERGFDILHKKILESGNDNIQIIVSGDFSQLPPVATKEDLDKYGDSLKNFCFESEAWKKRNFRSCYLDKLYRAKEKAFGMFLDAISSGKGDNKKVHDFIEKKLKKSSNPFIQGKAYLTTKNINVDKINTEQQLKNPKKAYSNKIEYNKKNLLEQSKKFAKELKIKEILTLKPGDTVMITDNLKKDDYDSSEYLAPELKNGTIGIFFVTEDGEWGIKIKKEKSNDYYYYYLSPKEYIKTKKKLNKETKEIIEYTVASFKQYPIKLAYAITIHKSQGQTFSDVVCDLTDCFAPGLGYVALSRATNFKGITLFENPLTKRTINSLSLKMNEESLDIKKKIKSIAKKNRKKYLKNHEDYWNLLNNNKKRTKL